MPTLILPEEDDVIIDGETAEKTLQENEPNPEAMENEIYPQETPETPLPPRP